MTVTPTRTRQIDLPGQTHVAEGPHDQTGMYVMHHAFRRDLARFQAAVGATPLEDGATWRALADRWRRFSETLHHHHCAEDEHIWPLMLRRVEERGEPDAATLAAMEDEHAGIHPALQACDTAFAAMAAGPDARRRDTLAALVASTRAALLEHLRHEETETLPLLQRVLTVADFEATERGAQRSYPISVAPFLVPWACDGLPDDVRARLLASVGAPYRVMLALFGGRYRRGEARAFRHV